MKVKADIKKNRLYFKISGKISKKEMDNLYTDVRFSVADLQPGFDVITDLSECTLAHLSGIPTFRKIMTYLIANGVGQVVRVMNGSSLIYKQIVNLSSRISGYKPSYVYSLEEAEEKLNAFMKRRSLRFQFNTPHPVDFFADDQKGTGCILDISTGGCAVCSASICPSADTEILLTFAFKTHDDSLNAFELKARVVRSKTDKFAVEFKDLEDEEKARLWQCLVGESKREA